MHCSTARRSTAISALTQSNPKQGEDDAFGFALADIIDNCTKRKLYGEAKKKHLLDAEAWHESELGRYYQAGKCPPSNVMFKGEEEVCNVTPHSEAAQQSKRAGGIIKHNTNAVKHLAAMQAFPGDNVDEGSGPEPPAKKAKQPANPVADGVPALSRPGGCWG
eukprot:jgi/Tetstr1/465365/TSEL_010051.t1